MNIPFSKVDCSGNELKYIREVLESGWLTTSSKTRDFEEKFAQIVDAKYALAVNSCTSALHLGLEALGVKKNDPVFVPAMTFTATAEVIRYLQADPVFLDIEYGTNLITPEILKKAIQKYPDVKYLMVVHYGGQSAEMINENSNGIYDICKNNAIRIIEDAAHAFPAKCKEKFIGSIGAATCFSFYANKTITTAEGGMLTTNDESVAQRAQVMRLHGINKDIWNRYTKNKPTWEYDVVAPGFKYNMPDVNAAIGLAQLERAFEMRKERQRCAEFYYKNLAETEQLDLPVIKGAFEDHAWHLFIITLNKNSKISRDKFIERMFEKGIGTSVHYKPLYRMSYYNNRYKPDPLNFPNTEKMWNGCVSLPIYTSLTEPELEYICNSIKENLGNRK